MTIKMYPRLAVAKVSVITSFLIAIAACIFHTVISELKSRHTDKTDHANQQCADSGGDALKCNNLCFSTLVKSGTNARPQCAIY